MHTHAHPKCWLLVCKAVHLRRFHITVALSLSLGLSTYDEPHKLTHNYTLVQINIHAQRSTVYEMCIAQAVSSTCIVHASLEFVVVLFDFLL